jgi:CheY-like chemotaxis protein
MNLNGEIIIIDDDADDRFILAEIIEKVVSVNNYKNQVTSIAESTNVIEYLKLPHVLPFMIICDISMPAIDGLTLRDMIYRNDEVNAKSIPFIFLTTSADPGFIKRAYCMSIQGYFVKPHDYKDFERMISDIIGYWKISKTPLRPELAIKIK